ncbi:retropepsin-like aspartic protease family protein [Roseovarius pelagicus]|uniref:TIGR02281 family clan AA aspartic protease n=1 Tax=Roseovarius pelagicus TaxID=2980108 RepID=A0ABY6DCI7_9RHOB|nr:TIGR02281 family clan AA aspartic protease [Roseovarius pelagicus]UXX83749.1 TIGR02281 family clan AA aspartic protease [Roseovarius pelagicus]
MNDFDNAHLIYLIVLGVAVVFWFVASNRNSLGKTMQYAVIWGLIFIGVLAGIGLWEDIRRTVIPSQSVYSGGVIELPRAPDGHYYLQAEVNGTSIRFVVDTGASQIVLSQADAAAVGLKPDTLNYFGTASTANGIVRTAPVRLDSFAVGDMRDANLRAVVNEGDLGDSLLGMTYLQRFSNIQIADGRLVLTR